jgi:hypothetical protein
VNQEESKPSEPQVDPPVHEPQSLPSGAQDAEPEASPFAPAETEIIQKNDGHDEPAFPKAETEEFLGGDDMDPDRSILLSNDDD